MLKLVHSLIEKQLKFFLENLKAEANPLQKSAVVISNPVLFAAICKFGREKLPNGVELAETGTSTDILNSDSPILICYGSETHIPFRKRVLLPAESSLTPPISRAIAMVLDFSNSNHFIDTFEGPIVKVLRDILNQEGLVPFLQAIQKILTDVGNDGVQRSTLEWVSELTKDSAKNKHKGNKGYPAVVGFIEYLSNMDCPHDYLKVFLSYYFYLKSNRNASKAAKNMNISRTTLHDHLKLAREYQIHEILAEGYFQRAPHLLA